MLATPTLEAQTIMIVDDNPTNLEVLSEALTNVGFRVVVAVDGQSAIDQVKYRPPELILLDVMMPGINGYETCSQLKSDPSTRDIPVLFMTALSDAENTAQGLSLGAVDYISKPFHQKEVIARVQTHLQLAHFSKALKEQNQLLSQEIERRKQAEQELRQLAGVLEQQKQELVCALEDVKKVQVQLVQNEKMSSLGQLVAGIAHEINNPANFIYGNFSHAKRYIQDLLELTQLYQADYPNPSPRIQDKIQEIDLDFLCVDLPKLTDSMYIGATRIREIVLSLRNFSRLDEADFKDADIHEGINNTLLILQYRLKAKPDHQGIKVIKEYGDLPLITCYPSQLNQVFMNLLVNAIDVLEQSEKDAKLSRSKQQQQDSLPVKPNAPSITIQTEMVRGNWVQICISDNGPGIPPDIQHKIFEPFFTTKPAGQGTGLGLSISYQIIVAKHGGKLDCISNEAGTKFVIEIPSVAA